MIPGRGLTGKCRRSLGRRVNQLSGLAGMLGELEQGKPHGEVGVRGRQTDEMIRRRVLTGKCRLALGRRVNQLSGLAGMLGELETPR